MENYVDEFLESLESPSTKKVARNVLGKMNLEDILEINNRTEFVHLILQAKPNSIKAVTTYLYTLRKFFEWLYNKGLVSEYALNALEDIQRTDVWELAKPNAKKFLTHAEFEETVHNIGLTEDYNALYYETLFRAIYEGIYSDDALSVIKNLRQSDIDMDNSIVTLHRDDGQEYKMKISNRLAEDLYDLSKVECWERHNRHGECKVKLVGLYSDSCFKKEERKSYTDNWYYCYYDKIRKITKAYLERNIKPMEIYVSGIMYRLNNIMKSHKISLEIAFEEQNRNKQVYQLIERELIRSGYNGTVGRFREIVSGYIPMFVSE